MQSQRQRGDNGQFASTSLRTASWETEFVFKYDGWGTDARIIEELLPQLMAANLRGGKTSIWSGPQGSNLKERLDNVFDILASVVRTDQVPSDMLAGDGVLTRSIFKTPPRYLVGASIPDNRTCSNSQAIPTLGSYHITSADGTRIGSPCLLVDPEKVKGIPYLSISTPAYLKMVLAPKGADGQAILEGAHRFVLWAVRGGPPKAAGATEEERNRKVVATHLCHNPNCLHPAHLQWGFLTRNAQNRVTLETEFQQPQAQ